MSKEQGGRFDFVSLSFPPTLLLPLLLSLGIIVIFDLFAYYQLPENLIVDWHKLGLHATARTSIHLMEVVEAACQLLLQHPNRHQFKALVQV